MPKRKTTALARGEPAKSARPATALVAESSVSDQSTVRQDPSESDRLIDQRNRWVGSCNTTSSNTQTGFAAWRQLFLINDTAAVLGSAVTDMRTVERNMRRPFILPPHLRRPCSRQFDDCQYVSPPLDPHRGLVPFFSSLWTLDVNNPTGDDSARFFQMLANVGQVQREETSLPATVPDLSHFRQNFKLDHYEESLGVLKRLEPLLVSRGIFIAGGSVLRALTSNSSGVQTRRGRFLGDVGDIDVFLCSKDPGVAGAYCAAVFEAVTRDHDFEVVVRKGVVDIMVRPKHARLLGWSDDTVLKVQLVLQLYESPAEVLLGFDVDACCLGFDGTEVWALPRAIHALRYGTNIVDPLRSKEGRARYEYRLVKYALRGYSISVPGVDPTRINADVIAAVPLDRLRGFERLVRLVLAFNTHQSGLGKCTLVANDEVDVARFDWYSGLGWSCNEGLASVLKASLGCRQYDKLVKGTCYNPEHKSIWPRVYEELRLSSKDALPKWRVIESVGGKIQLSWTSNNWANALHYNFSEYKCALDYFVSVDSVILGDWASKQYCSIGVDLPGVVAERLVAEMDVPAERLL